MRTTVLVTRELQLAGGSDHRRQGGSMQAEKVTLYFKQGTSNKVYSAALEAAGNHTFVVNFAYGRRGATLNTGTKTKALVDYAAAKKIYDELVTSKRAEGYVPGAASGLYVHTDTEAKATGLF